MGKFQTYLLILILGTGVLLTVAVSYHNSLVRQIIGDIKKQSLIASYSVGADFTCRTATEIPLSECETLVTLYDTTNGVHWSDKAGWLLTATPCTWTGVTCKNGHVVELDLESHNLSGELASIDFQLPQLENLELSQNHLTGSIPPGLSALVSLKSLSLWNNQLAGVIPPELGNLSNLTVIYLPNNQLEGEIPASLSNLSKLKYLVLNRNRLSGSIPPQLGNLLELKKIWLRDNQLTGIVPSELGNLVNLQEIQMSHNQLTGSLPPTLGNLLKLQRLSLEDNQLTGKVPSTLGNLLNLEEIILNNNQFSNSLPPELGNLVKLQNLSLEHNQLTGEIPQTLGQLRNLRSLYLNDNHFSGKVPRELGYARKLYQLSLANNLLEGQLPGSFVNLSLRTFQFEGTTLCELIDTAFQAWLKNIPILTKSDQVCNIQTYSITGEAKDALDNPVEGVLVLDGSGNIGFTNNAGQFAFSGLASGTFVLTGTLDGQALRSTVASVTLPPDAANIIFYLDPPPPISGIANIKRFLDRCPQNDPFYAQLRTDFILRRNGSPIGEIPCTEPVTGMGSYPEALAFLQAFQAVYYMDNGLPGKLPWTSLTLYEWLKSKIRGINFSDTTESTLCCVRFDGEAYMVVHTGNSSQNIPSFLAHVAVIFHEARHVDGFLHNTDCELQNSCDRTYDVHNLSPYAMQAWLTEQWLSGAINAGIACLETTELQEITPQLIDDHNRWAEHFVENLPPVFSTVGNPGGGCAPYLVSPLYFDLGLFPEPGPRVDRYFQIQQASGTTQLNWTISKNASWLVIEPISGIGDAVVHIVANTSSLQNGAYEDKVTITSNDPLVPTQTVTVHLAVDTGEVEPETVDLILSAVSPLLQLIGNNLTVQFTIQNKGPKRAEDVFFTYNLPTGTPLVSITASQGVCNNATCNLGSLENAALATITLSIKPSGLGTLVSSASVKSSVTESNAVDNYVKLTSAVVESLQNLYLPIVQR